jgi:uridine phosphorylase
MSIPIFPKNYEQKVIITPKQHLHAEKEDYGKFSPPKSVIFCYEKYIMDHIQERFEVDSMKFWTCDIHYFKNTNNKVAIAANFGIGGPASCHLLEILVASGVNNFIMLGHAGGLQKSNPVGMIILCEKAIRDEGVSYHYLKEIFIFFYKTN